jgi:hypothetical protein
MKPFISPDLVRIQVAGLLRAHPELAEDHEGLPTSTITLITAMSSPLSVDSRAAISVVTRT